MRKFGEFVTSEYTEYTEKGDARGSERVDDLLTLREDWRMVVFGVLE